MPSKCQIGDVRHAAESVRDCGVCMTTKDKQSTLCANMFISTMSRLWLSSSRQQTIPCDPYAKLDMCHMSTETLQSVWTAYKAPSLHRHVVQNVFLSAMCQLWMSSSRQQTIPCEGPAKLDMCHMSAETLQSVWTAYKAPSLHRHVVQNVFLSAMCLWMSSSRQQTIPCEGPAKLDMCHMSTETLQSVWTAYKAPSIHRHVVQNVFLSAMCLWMSSSREQRIPCEGPAKLDMCHMSTETLQSVWTPYKAQSIHRHVVQNVFLSAMCQLWMSSSNERKIPCDGPAKLDLCRLHHENLCDARQASS